MADQITRALWDQLRLRPLPERWEPVSPNGKDIGCFVLVDDMLQLHLLLAFQDDGDLPADTNGLTFRTVLFREQRCLDLKVQMGAEPQFTPLFNLIIDGIVRQLRDPFKITKEVVQSWQRNIRPATQELERFRQIGMMGELLTLRFILLPTLGPRAISLWSGPNKERHDFVGERLHIETKATCSTHHRHIISRLDQLRAPHGKRLLLVSVRLEETIGGTLTLSTIRQEVQSMLIENMVAMDRFDDQMSKLGWRDELVQTGNLLRFEVAGISVFAVEGSFPRLPDDLNLPPGVTDTKYGIDLSHEPELAQREVHELLIRGM